MKLIINKYWLVLFQLFLCNFVLIVYVKSQENYHKNNGQEHEQLGPQLSPLGYLDAFGIFQVGRDDIIVKIVDEKGPAGRGGLKIGDVITAANGKKFDKATNNVDDGGKGPREDLGNAMEQSLLSKYKTLKLTVNRNGDVLILKINLPNIPALSKTYPYYCKRTYETLDRIGNVLLGYQEPDGSWGEYVRTAITGLALLSTGDRKYQSFIKRAAHHFIGKDLSKTDYPTWNYTFGGTFLCEYYLATGDTAVLDTIKEINDILALKATSEDGKHSHEVTTIPSYKGAGLNIITSHVYLFWTLAAKCGLKLHEKQYKATFDHLKNCTETTGGTGYLSPHADDDSSARTGLFSLGLYLSGDDDNLLKVQTKYLEKYTRRMRESHTNGLFGMIWGTAALASAYPQGFRTHMDYWKWYINMGRTPEGHKLARYYIGSKRNNGGDGYLGWDKFNHAAIGMMLGTGQKKLFIHGNTIRNWYNNNSGEAAVVFYSKIYKDKIELIEFLSKRIDEISQHNELKNTLKFIRAEMRGPHAKRVSIIYKEINNKVLNDIKTLKVLSNVFPAKAYGLALKLHKSLIYDSSLQSRIKELIIELQGDEKVRILFAYRVRLEKVLKTPANRHEISLLCQQLQKFLISKNNTSIQNEAQMMLEKLNSFSLSQEGLK